MDVPQYKTFRFYFNTVVSILGALLQAGVIPAEWAGVVAALAGVGNLAISTGKRNETVAPILGYRGGN